MQLTGQVENTEVSKPYYYAAIPVLLSSHIGDSKLAFSSTL